jgi:hypothetical protein
MWMKSFPFRGRPTVLFAELNSCVYVAVFLLTGVMFYVPEARLPQEEQGPRPGAQESWPCTKQGVRL